MSGFVPPPNNPDGRIFASYPMPAKIDLINERPRRESLVDRELNQQIGSSVLPKIELSSQQFSTTTNYHNQALPPTQRIEENQNFRQYEQHVITNVAPLQSANNSQQQQYMQQPAGSMRTTTLLNNEAFNRRLVNNAELLSRDLAEKEAKLMAEINSLHQRPYSPFQTPDKIDLTNEQRKIQQQLDNAPSPRPYSRASSTRSTSAAADLLDKEAKLLQEIEEMERKPYNPQTMVVEREQWFEYPQGRPNDMQLTDSKRRVKDFCSLPSHMYETGDRHVHEENLPSTSSLSRPNSSAGSIHTTIIRSPKREIDNRSPLPIAFDNFSTKGVRGNIASIGAIEPDRPRPPIYPIIKRSPSPNLAR